MPSKKKPSSSGDADVGSRTRTIQSKVSEEKKNNLDGLHVVANLIKEGKAKNVIVMCGAGVSVAAGIPDFRTPKTGLYDNLQKYNLPTPEAIFTLPYFKKNPAPFYTLAKELYPGNFCPTVAHYFFRLLETKGLLRRLYTQNIDSLEHLAGVSKERVVAAHGNFDSAHTVRTKQPVDTDEVKAAILAGEPGWRAMVRRHHNDLVKPDIVFFGEALPSRFFECSRDDFPACDLLIVCGTSLVVHPFASLVTHVPSPNVPRLLINRELVGDDLGLGRRPRDVAFYGDCDDGVRELCRLLGWSDELDALVAEGRRTFAESKPLATDTSEKTVEKPLESTGEVAVTATATAAATVVETSGNDDAVTEEISDAAVVATASTSFVPTTTAKSAVGTQSGDDDNNDIVNEVADLAGSLNQASLSDAPLAGIWRGTIQNREAVWALCLSPSGSVRCYGRGMLYTNDKTTAATTTTPSTPCVSYRLTGDADFGDGKPPSKQSAQSAQSATPTTKRTIATVTLVCTPETRDGVVSSDHSGGEGAVDVNVGGDVDGGETETHRCDLILEKDGQHCLVSTDADRKVLRLVLQRSDPEYHAGVWVGEAVPHAVFAADTPRNPITWCLAWPKSSKVRQSLAPAMGAGFFDDAADVPGSPVLLFGLYGNDHDHGHGHDHLVKRYWGPAEFYRVDYTKVVTSTVEGQPTLTGEWTNPLEGTCGVFAARLLG